MIFWSWNMNNYKKKAHLSCKWTWSKAHVLWCMCLPICITLSYMFKEKFFLPAALPVHMEQRGEMTAARIDLHQGVWCFHGSQLPITATRWQPRSTKNLSHKALGVWNSYCLLWDLASHLPGKQILLHPQPQNKCVETKQADRRLDQYTSENRLS